MRRSDEMFTDASALLRRRCLIWPWAITDVAAGAAVAVITLIIIVVVTIWEIEVGLCLERGQGTNNRRMDDLGAKECVQTPRASEDRFC